MGCCAWKRMIWHQSAPPLWRCGALRQGGGEGGDVDVVHLASGSHEVAVNFPIKIMGWCLLTQIKKGDLSCLILEPAAARRTKIIYKLDLRTCKQTEWSKWSVGFYQNCIILHSLDSWDQHLWCVDIGQLLINITITLHIGLWTEAFCIYIVLYLYLYLWSPAFCSVFVEYGTCNCETQPP